MSGRDIGDVIRLLGTTDLQELLHALNIKDTDIEKEEKNASSDHPDLKARAVFNFWMKVNGNNATRQSILDALVKCDNIEATENLQDIWDEKGKTKKCPVIGQLVWVTFTISELKGNN